MHYKELVFTLLSAEDHYRDLMINQLANIGFDSFEESPLGFKAYIPSSGFSEKAVAEAIQPFQSQITFNYQVNLIPHKNWNQVWESNFSPITIGSCHVRATFHEPRQDAQYEIIIDPKMAFGTGHHQTTALMIEFILEQPPAGNHVLDMGCGSGILAILAAKTGAISVTAIDNDPVCCQSTTDNALLNAVSDIEVSCGSADAIHSRQFDYILANINRNILLEQLPAYRAAIRTGGLVFLSGFYEGTDLEMILQRALEQGFAYQEHKTAGQWAAVKLKAV